MTKCKSEAAHREFSRLSISCLFSSEIWKINMPPLTNQHYFMLHRLHCVMSYGLQIKWETSVHKHIYQNSKMNLSHGSRIFHTPNAQSERCLSSFMSVGMVKIYMKWKRTSTRIIAPKWIRPCRLMFHISLSFLVRSDLLACRGQDTKTRNQCCSSSLLFLCVYADVCLQVCVCVCLRVQAALQRIPIIFVSVINYQGSKQLCF